MYFLFPMQVVFNPYDLIQCSLCDFAFPVLSVLLLVVVVPAIVLPTVLLLFSAPIDKRLDSLTIVRRLSMRVLFGFPF